MPRCYAKPYKTETLPLLQNCDRPILLGSLHPTRVLTCVITTTCHYTIQVSELLPINPLFSVSIVPLWNSLHHDLVSSSNCDSFEAPLILNVFINFYCLHLFSYST